MRRMIHLLAAAASTAALAGAVSASETITYTFDELGRLTKTESSGTVNAGVTAAIAYDAAGNRTAQAVSGSSGSAAVFDPGGAAVAWASAQSLQNAGALRSSSRWHARAFRPESPSDAGLMEGPGTGPVGESSTPAHSPF